MTVYLLVKTKEKELGGCPIKVEHQKLFWVVAKNCRGVGT